MYSVQLNLNQFKLIPPGNVFSCTLTKDVWFAIRDLGHSIVIKPANKRSCVVFSLKSFLLEKAYR